MACMLMMYHSVERAILTECQNLSLDRFLCCHLLKIPCHISHDRCEGYGEIASGLLRIQRIYADLVISIGYCQFYV